MAETLPAKLAGDIQHLQNLLSERRLDESVAFWHTGLTRDPAPLRLLHGVNQFVQSGARTAALFLLEQGGVDFSGHPLLTRWQGDLLARENRFAQAQEVLTRALELEADPPNTPTLTHTLDILAGVSLSLGGYGRIADAHLQAVRRTPSPDFVARYLLLAAFRPEFDGAAFRARAEELVSLLPSRPVRHGFGGWDWSPDRRLRLVVTTRHSHCRLLGLYQVLPVMRFLQADPRFDLIVLDGDYGPAEFAALWQAEHIKVQSVARLSEPDLCSHITALKPDILFDLTGHDSAPLGLITRHRLAPVQTTVFYAELGTPEMDHVLISGHLMPPDPEMIAAPLLASLPVLSPYETRDAEVPIKPGPVMQNGYVTFGSLNALMKITDDCLGLWSRILQAEPAARLLIKAAGLDDPPTAAQFRSRLIRLGMPVERVRVCGHVPERDYIDLHGQIDILLDTFPYNGATTTLRALWHGLPCVSLRGNMPYARMGYECLYRVGLGDCVAGNKAAYLRIARRLAARAQEYSAQREALRRRLQYSPLMNAQRYGQTLADSLYRLWRCRADKAAAGPLL